MKNQITTSQKWVQNAVAVFLMLLVSFSSFAQHPGGGHGGPGGGGNGPGNPPPIPNPGPHPGLFCNAHFFHHRDSVVNGVRFFNLPGTGAATYAWDFGDGSTSTSSNPSHTYADTGVYNVCFTITDTIGGGCTDTWCDSIHVFTPAPHCNAHFHVRPDSVANSVRFFAAQRGHGQNNSATYSWDFGDGTGTSTDATPTYTYAAAGTYYVCLTVSNTNAGGSCTDTWCDSVNTNFPPCPGPGPGHGGHNGHKVAGDGIVSTDVVVSVYPNPMTESSTIYLENTSGNATIRVYNMTGQVSYSRILGNGNNTISKENLSEGLYFYSIDDGSTNIAKGKLQVN